jgi:GT2 family glycosyltransferase
MNSAKQMVPFPTFAPFVPARCPGTDFGVITRIVPQAPANDAIGSSGVLDRIFSAGRRFGDQLRRIRYRRADLRRVPATEMVSDAPSADDRFRWLPSSSLAGGVIVALECRPGSRIAYDVMLPPRAQVAVQCAAVPRRVAQVAATVDFEVRVRMESGAEFAVRRSMRAKQSRAWQQWRGLRLRIPHSGRARIILTTRTVQGGTGREVSALWGNPQILSPRPVSQVVSMVSSATSLQTLRRLAQHAFSGSGDRLYDAWVRETRPSPKTLREQREWSRGQTRFFSLITFVPEPERWDVQPTASSVLAQTYSAWEWLLVTREESMAQLAAKAASAIADPRVRLVTAPSGCVRADAWNAGLRDSRGEFAALLDPHDSLEPTALYEVARALERDSDSDLLYSDEDVLTGTNGRRHQPQFKPDWSPELLVARNYIGRLAMVRVSLATAAGRFRADFQDGEEWELFLRMSRSAARIKRVPQCLYHRSDVAAQTETRRQPSAIVQEHFAELGREVTVSTAGPSIRVNWAVTGSPIVSIIVPSRNAGTVIKQCMRGLLEQTHYPHREIILVDNGSTEPDVLDFYNQLQQDRRCRIVPFNTRFNFSAACNAGAAQARGDLLLFLNNDIEVIQSDWLDELVQWAQVPEIGVVGPKLLYPDRLIQHAGVVFGLGLVGHIFSRAPENIATIFGTPECYRNYLAVTGACQMIRKDVFRQLGGYDERFRLSFSDVVLCLRAREHGYRVMYTPHARLVHHESYSRDREDEPGDIELLARYIVSSGFVEDPFFHPELNAKSPVPAVRPPFDPGPAKVVHDRVERVLSAAQIVARPS